MKRIIILGTTESGVGAAILAQKEGFGIFISDMGEIKNKYEKTLDKHNVRWEEKYHTSELILNIDEIIKSPGIPKEAPTVQKAMAKSVDIISEIEFVGRYTHSKMICITGSNDKTTTTSLIYHIFKSAGYDAGLADNIGRSLALQVAEDPHEYYIIELDLFQLDNMYKFKADIVIPLNITPDHLGHYGDCIQNYVNAKIRIIQNQTVQDSFIYRNGDPVIERELKEYNIKVVQCPFSELKERGLVGYTEEGEHIIEKPTSFNMEQETPVLTDEHNIYDSLVAGIAADVASIRNEVIRKSLSDFPGMEHCLEKVCKMDGVQYINNSKATNVGVCQYVLESVRAPTVLILGGRDEGNDHDPIKDLMKEKCVALMYLRVDNNRLYSNSDSLGIPVHDIHSMKECMAACYELAKPGDTVLLSPCCASFDLFKNMEDRGDQSKTLVRNL